MAVQHPVRQTLRGQTDPHTSQTAQTYPLSSLQATDPEQRIFILIAAHVRPHHGRARLEREDVADEGVLVALVDDHVGDLDDGVLLRLREHTCDGHVTRSGSRESAQKQTAAGYNPYGG